LSPYSVDDNAVFTTPLVTTTTFTNQDLSQMFPTPPSLEEPMTHQTMSPTNTDLHITSVHSVALLSPGEPVRGSTMDQDYHLIRPPLMV